MTEKSYITLLTGDGIFRIERSEHIPVLINFYPIDYIENIKCDLKAGVKENEPKAR